MSIIVVLLISSFARSGSTQPEIGKIFPDFAVTNVRNYNSKRVSLADFKGKWLFLDFWALTCKTCIESFPKVNLIQNEFPGDVQFLLIGKNNTKYDKGIERVYDRVSKNLNLKMAAAFDSVLMESWNIRSVPHIYIIDPEGIVRFITDGRDMTIEKVRSLVDGRDVSFYRKDRDDERAVFDVSQSNGSDKLLYSSMLTKWSGESQFSGYAIDQYVNFPVEYWEKGWSVAMAPLYALYNYAYLGRWSWQQYDTALYGRFYAYPILDVRDSSMFQYDYNFDPGKGTYNYFLKAPNEKITQNYIMKEIQRSLENVFGHKVSIEEREMPVWKLITKRGAAKRLQSEGGKPFFSGGNTISGFAVRNYSVKEFLSLATCNLPNNQQFIFIDDTGISNNIDITLDADMTSYETVRRVLQKNGLDLVKATKEMKVLVIRDSK